MGAFRVVVATALLVLGVSGCGSSARGPSTPDQVTIQRINGLLSALTQLQGQINLAPRVHRPAAYLRSDGPLIDRFGRTSRQLGREIKSLQDAQAAAIYLPLGTAIAQETRDMRRYLNAVVAHHAASTERFYSRLNRDQLRVNRVALAQFPKARAYAVKAAG